eukprot:GHVO01044460.1.p1 GENE.GHVO01044460.1~~GHVO01044460.1.p1  ORF type:complete len:201 (-),score=46.07 GHVO01044460.1:70-582(-)
MDKCGHHKHPSKKEETPSVTNGDKMGKGKTTENGKGRISCEYLPPRKCILRVIGNKNPQRYIVATCDKKLEENLSKIPLVPLLTFRGNTARLAPPSEATTKVASKVEGMSQIENEKLNISPHSKNIAKKKRRKIKSPNPLSCLKKKKKDEGCPTPPQPKKPRIRTKRKEA